MKVFPITRQRYVNYLPAKLRRINPVLSDWGQQFIPFSHETKDADCCVIANGVPKGGTHLLHSILNYLGKWENINVFIDVNGWKYSDVSGHRHLDVESGKYVQELEPFHYGIQRFTVKKLRKGQMAAGHLPWNQELAKSFSQAHSARRLKHVMIYRDPRDMYVSAMKFFVNKENYSAAYTRRDLFTQQVLNEKCSSDDELLTYFIENRNYTPMHWEPWLRDPHCFPVKFEDLYPEILASRDNVMGEVLRNLLNFLEIDVKSIDPVGFHDNVNGKSTTASPEIRKIGQYKRVFKDQHYALLDNPEFRKSLAAFGYEW